MVQPWRFVEAGYAAAILSRHRSTLTPIENELAETPADVQKHKFKWDIMRL